MPDKGMLRLVVGACMILVPQRSSYAGTGIMPAHELTPFPIPIPEQVHYSWLENTGPLCSSEKCFYVISNLSSYFFVLSFQYVGDVTYRKIGDIEQPVH